MIEPYYEQDGITIYHGDAREVLPDIDVAGLSWLLDPPYSSGGLQEAGRVAGSFSNEGNAKARAPIHADNLSTRGYMNLLRECFRYSREAPEIGVFTDWRMWPNTVDALEYAGWAIRAMVVWDKGGAGMGRPWRSTHELLAYGMRRSASKDRIAREANVMRCNRSGNVSHPTEKPLELVKRIVANMEGDGFLDPFMGSGTTLVAAKLEGRKAIGIEIEERYCEIAANRLAQGVLAFEEAM